MLKKIAVLLTCHNRREKSLACLKYLFKATLPVNYAIEVFLVDDGSIDGTSQAINIEFPAVNIIKGSGDLFWNRGMHLAWDKAAKTGYPFYLWLNDDTILFETAISELLKSSKEMNNKS